MNYVIAAFCLALACTGPAFAQGTPKDAEHKSARGAEKSAKKEPSEKQTAQQQRMTDCNAKAKGMKGEARTDFMSKCLSGKDVAASKPTQQEKMTLCNKDASAKNLKGEERRKFMSSCLKG